MKILEKCLILAWDGILTPARKRDSLEVCAEKGHLSSGGNQTRRRGRMVTFRLLQTSRIDGNMYFLKKRDSLGVCLRLWGAGGVGGRAVILEFRGKLARGMGDSYFDMFIPRINNRSDHMVITNEWWTPLRAHCLWSCTSCTLTRGAALLSNYWSSC